MTIFSIYLLCILFKTQTGTRARSNSNGGAPSSAQAPWGNSKRDRSHSGSSTANAWGVSAGPAPVPLSLSAAEQQQQQLEKVQTSLASGKIAQHSAGGGNAKGKGGKHHSIHSGASSGDRPWGAKQVVRVSAENLPPAIERRSVAASVLPMSVVGVNRSARSEGLPFRPWDRESAGGERDMGGGERQTGNAPIDVSAKHVSIVPPGSSAKHATPVKHSTTEWGVPTSVSALKETSPKGDRQGGRVPQKARSLYRPHTQARSASRVTPGVVQPPNRGHSTAKSRVTPGVVLRPSSSASSDRVLYRPHTQARSTSDRGGGRSSGSPPGIPTPVGNGGGGGRVAEPNGSLVASAASWSPTTRGGTRKSTRGGAASSQDSGVQQQQQQQREQTLREERDVLLVSGTLGGNLSGSSIAAGSSSSISAGDEIRETRPRSISTDVLSTMARSLGDLDSVSGGGLGFGGSSHQKQRNAFANLVSGTGSHSSSNAFGSGLGGLGGGHSGGLGVGHSSDAPLWGSDPFSVNSHSSISPTDSSVNAFDAFAGVGGGQRHSGGLGMTFGSPGDGNGVTAGVGNGSRGSTSAFDPSFKFDTAAPFGFSALPDSFNHALNGMSALGDALSAGASAASSSNGTGVSAGGEGGSRSAALSSGESGVASSARLSPPNAIQQSSSHSSISPPGMLILGGGAHSVSGSRSGSGEKRQQQQQQQQQQHTSLGAGGMGSAVGIDMGFGALGEAIGDSMRQPAFVDVGVRGGGEGVGSGSQGSGSLGGAERDGADLGLDAFLPRFLAP